MAGLDLHGGGNCRAVLESEGADHDEAGLEESAGARSAGERPSVFVGPRSRPVNGPASRRTAPDWF